MATAGSIVLSLLMATGAFETDTARAEAIAKKRAKAIEKAFTDMSGQIGSAVGGIFAGLSAAAAVGKLVSVQREFDVLNSSLVTITGSSAAAAREFSWISDFAATTPYSLAEVTEAFIKMRSLGLDASQASLQSYGNTASAMGKGLNQMIEAVADATTGEFERLKEFGIKAKQEGDKVSLTFQGVTKNIGNNASEISRYLADIGNNQFAGAMEERAKTLDGAISNLADTWDQLFLTINQNNAGSLIHDSVKLATGTIQDAITIIKSMNTAAADNASQTGAMKVAQEGLATVMETVAVLGVNVAYVLRQTGNELGGLAAQAAAVARLDFAGASAIGDAMKEDAAAARAEVDRQTEAILNARKQAAELFGPPVIGSSSATSGSRGSSGGDSKKKKGAAYTDPLADEAKAYAAAMDAINKAQMSAQTSGMELTATQQRLIDLFASPEWLTMPDAWKQSVVQQAEFSIEAENAAKKTEELNKQQERLRDLLGETDLEKKRADMLLLAEAFESGRITAEEYGLAVKNALGVGDDEGGYWDKWLKAAEESLTSFDELAGNVVENFGRQFGNTFEKMIFDSQSLGDAVTGLAEGMARSVVNALGQMAAQWLAYQVVQMVVGKTTAASAATAQTFEAMAAQQMAAINAFASTAAIPIVGPELAPAAAEAALMATTPFVATIASLGAAAAGARADGGPVSANAPYLIGERGPELFVPNTAGRVLPNSALGGNASPTINLIEDRRRAGQTQQRNTNGRDEIDVFVADILGDGPRAKAVQKAFGLQRRGY